MGPLKVAAADAGPIEEMMSVSDFVTVCGSPTRPTIEIIAISAGKIDNTA
jgi:hypothetical protein